jgi:hypothetical protein
VGFDSSLGVLAQIEIPPDAFDASGKLNTEYSLWHGATSPGDIQIAQADAIDVTFVYTQPQSSVGTALFYWNSRPFANPAYWRMTAIVRGDSDSTGRVLLGGVHGPPKLADNYLWDLAMEFNQATKILSINRNNVRLLTYPFPALTATLWYRIGLEAVGPNVRLYFNTTGSGTVGGAQDEYSLNKIAEFFQSPPQVAKVKMWPFCHFGGSSGTVRTEMMNWTFYDLEAPLEASGMAGTPSSSGGVGPIGGMGPSPTPLSFDDIGPFNFGGFDMPSMYNSYKSIRKAILIYNNLSLTG